MPKQPATQSTWLQTTLLVVGIVIALLLSLRTFVFAPEPSAIPTSVEQPVEKEKKNELSSKEEPGGGGGTLHSSARLFQLFTENLPYLNSK